MEYIVRAKEVTPGGAQTLSKMPARFPQGEFPVAYKSADKARMTDIDGNEYVDWICGLGAVTLGHRHTVVDAAVHAMIENGGCSSSLPHVIEMRVAEKLRRKIPCAEMVRFVNSGSEATEAAIRTARIATGRDIILTVKTGYHSWHSWFQAVKDWHPGVPREYEDLVKGFTYNNLDSIHQRFDEHSYSTASCQVAAVIMEPCLFETPDKGFLQGVKNLCREFGALLIFDETVTGFRWATGGGQDFFSVMPDLATFGKGMANGYPIGMLCGKKEYMQHAELISGTFGGNPVSLAAADAVLDVYASEPIIHLMWWRGGLLQEYFNHEAERLKVPAICDGFSCKPRIRFTMDDEKAKSASMSLFLQETAAAGVLFHPGGFNVSSALTSEDMDASYAAIEKGLSEVRRSLRTNDWSRLKGAIVQPVVTVRQ